METLSIGIPTYNQGEFLEQTIISILNQTMMPYEIVVCNNHSTDGLTDVVLEKYSDRIKVISPPNFLDMMENWNYLCKNLSGDYIALISSDDWYEPNFVETFYSTLKPDGVLYRFAYNLIDQNNNILEKKRIRSVKYRQTFPGNFYEQMRTPKVSFAAFVIKTEAVKAVNYFDEDLKIIGDWGMWLKLSPLGTFYYINKIVSNYRMDYRPSISVIRFNGNCADIHIVYSKIQKEIIEKHNLSNRKYNRAIKLQFYLMDRIRIENNLEMTNEYQKLRSIINGKPFKTRLKFELITYFEKIIEILFKR